MYAACANCRMSASGGCHLGNVPDVDGRRCDEYEMTDAFRELLLERIRGDYSSRVVRQPASVRVDMPVNVTR